MVASRGTARTVSLDDGHGSGSWRHTEVAGSSVMELRDLDFIASDVSVRISDGMAGLRTMHVQATAILRG